MFGNEFARALMNTYAVQKNKGESGNDIGWRGGAVWYGHVRSGVSITIFCCKYAYRDVSWRVKSDLNFRDILDVPFIWLIMRRVIPFDVSNVYPRWCLYLTNYGKDRLLTYLYNN